MKLFATYPSSQAVQSTLQKLKQLEVEAWYEVLMVNKLAEHCSQPVLVCTSGQTTRGLHGYTLANYPCNLFKALLGRGLSFDSLHPVMQAFADKQSVLILNPDRHPLDWDLLLRQLGALEVIVVQNRKPMEVYETVRSNYYSFS